MGRRMLNAIHKMNGYIHFLIPHRGNYKIFLCKCITRVRKQKDKYMYKLSKSFHNFNPHIVRNNVWIQEAWNCMSTSSRWGSSELPKARRIVHCSSSTHNAWSRYVQLSLLWIVLNQKNLLKKMQFWKFLTFSPCKKEHNASKIICRSTKVLQWAIVTHSVANVQ